LRDLKEEYKTLEFIEEHRLTIYFCNKNFPSLRRICTSLSKQDPSFPESALVRNFASDQLLDSLKKIYNFYHGRIPKFEQILLWYPEYLTKFSDLEKAIITEEGPLPIDWRYFVAILSVSAYGCEYLYSLLLEAYVQVGGDITWLNKDSTTLPQKLKNIIAFNSQIAYKPWGLIQENENHFSGLLESQDAWTRQELLQMITISAFYHSLCCLVYGMGILPEFDFPRDQQKDAYLKADDELWKTMVKNSPMLKRTNEDIIQQLRKLANENGTADQEEIKDESEAQKIVFEVQKSQEKTPKNSSLDDLGEDTIPSEELSSITTCPHNNSILESFFGTKPVFFESYPTNKKTIDIEVYEWKTIGYPFLLEGFPEITSKIDAKLEYINKMTLGNFGNEKNVKTDPFRRAIVYYLENIHGYSHPDFDYKQMNVLLHKDLKLALKTIGTTPQNFNFGLLNKIPIDFKPYEVCHIILLIMEAKFQIELMYGVLGLKNYEL